MHEDRRVCKVVADWDCKAPANVQDTNPVLRSDCYRCGEPVCSSPGCSRRVVYLGERRRLCTICIDEETRFNKRTTDHG